MSKINLSVGRAEIKIKPEENLVSLYVDELFSTDLVNNAKAVLQFRQQNYPRYDLEIAGINQEILLDYLKKANTHPLLDAGFVPKVYSGLDEIARMYLRMKEVGWTELVRELYRRDDHQADEDERFLYELISSNWIYYTNETLLKTAQKSPTSAAAIISGRERVLFDQSRRAYTDMATLRPTSFPTIILSEEQEATLRNQRMLVINDITYLPITRYAEGMSRGAYYQGDDTTRTYCGTFYYLEADSEVLLTVSQSRMLYFKNKLEAARWLLERGITKNKSSLHSSYNKVLVEYYYQLKKRNLIDTTLDEQSIIREIEISLTSDRWSDYLGIDEFYQDRITGEYINIFYALEDDLDQVICEGLRQLNCDIAILGMMAGKSRMVAEVLDTRTRDKSLASLVYIVK